MNRTDTTPRVWIFVKFNIWDINFGIKKCENCGFRGNYKPTRAMTAYHWNREKDEEDPNRDLILCQNCQGEYQEFWAAQWKEYNDLRY